MRRWVTASSLALVLIGAGGLGWSAQAGQDRVSLELGPLLVVRPKRMVPIRLDKSPHKIIRLVGRFT